MIETIQKIREDIKNSFSEESKAELQRVAKKNNKTYEQVSEEFVDFVMKQRVGEFLKEKGH